MFYVFLSNLSFLCFFLSLLLPGLSAKYIQISGPVCFDSQDVPNDIEPFLFEKATQHVFLGTVVP